MQQRCEQQFKNIRNAFFVENAPRHAGRHEVAEENSILWEETLDDVLVVCGHRGEETFAVGSPCALCSQVCPASLLPANPESLC